MLPNDLLIANALAVHRGGTLLTELFSCAITKGQAIWLTGPNGVGKSTLLRVLAGVQPPLRGTVQLADFIYQPSDAGFDARLTITQNLAWWAAIHKTQDLRLIDVLATVDIAAQAHLPYATLSQGQKQRAALARLFMSTATLWLLDEPLAHLDAQGQALFYSMARVHLKRGGAMIAATHDTSLLPEARVIDMRGVDV